MESISFDGDADDVDVIVRFVVLFVHFGQRHLLHDFHSLFHSTEDGVFVIQPRRGNDRNEILTAIGSGAWVRGKRSSMKREYARWMILVSYI